MGLNRLRESLYKTSHLFLDGELPHLSTASLLALEPLLAAETARSPENICSFLYRKYPSRIPNRFFCNGLAPSSRSELIESIEDALEPPVQKKLVVYFEEPDSFDFVINPNNRTRYLNDLLAQRTTNLPSFIRDYPLHAGIVLSLTDPTELPFCDFSDLQYRVFSRGFKTKQIGTSSSFLPEINELVEIGILKRSDNIYFLAEKYKKHEETNQLSLFSS